MKPISNHARYAPSAMSRAINCPVSVVLSEPLPVKPPGRAAIEGTIAHQAAEIATSLKLEGHKVEFTKTELLNFNEEMIYHANGYANYILELVQPYMEFEHTWDAEKKVHFDERSGWGTADFIFIYKDSTGKLHGILVDYKYGENVVVDERENWQLMSYAYGLYKLCESKLETITVHVYQPRVGRAPDPVTYTKKDLDTYIIPTITALIDLCEYWFSLGEIPDEDMNRFQRMGDWCRFCPAKDSVCRLQNKEKTDKAIALFKKAQAALPDTKKKTLTSPEMLQSVLEKGVLNEESFAWFVENGSELKNLVDGIKAAALSILAKGGKIKGLKLIEGKHSRKFIGDTDKVVQELKKLGISEPVTFVEKLIGIGDAEKLLGNIPEYLLEVPSEPLYKVVPIGSNGKEVETGETLAIRLFKDKLVTKGEKTHG